MMMGWDEKLESSVVVVGGQRRRGVSTYLGIMVNIPPKWYFCKVFACFTRRRARKISSTTYLCTSLSRT